MARTLIGCTTSGTGLTWDQLTARCQAELDVRHHYESDLPTSWYADTECKQDADLGRCITVGSVKPWASGGGPLRGQEFTDRITSYLKTVPSGHDYRCIVFHEPEDEIEAGRFTVADYIDWQVRTRDVIDTLNATRAKPIKLLGTLMAWSCDKGQSGRTVMDYMPPPGTWDGLGWDGYDRRWKLKGDSEPASSLFSHAKTADFPSGGPLQVNTTLNLPFFVIETGSPDDNPQRVQWILDSISWCNEVAKAVFWCYWNNDLFATWRLDTDAEYQALGSGVSYGGSAPPAEDPQVTIDKLTQQVADLTAELTATKGELASVKASYATAQADLAKANDKLNRIEAIAKGVRSPSRQMKQIIAICDE